MTTASDALPTVFDADNHYWEASDAFTRYRSPEFADRGVLVKEVDGRLRYVVHGELHPWIPGPGDANPRPQPGAFLDRSGRSIADMLTAEDPGEHPEWFHRDARLPVMDAQGVEGCWMFPSQGVCMEGPMQPDVEAILDIFRAFNRWLDDEWGFAYHDRIFGAPYLTLSDLDAAVRELEWVIGRGARIVAVRPGPVFTPDGWRSPADPAFDPFWARVSESRLIVACHPGFDDGYRDVEDAVARSWGYGSRRRAGPVSSLNYYEPVVGALMSHRLIEDFMVVITAHGLFERHPGLRVASIENGVAWVPGALAALRRLSGSDLGATGSARLVDQFHEHVWVTPFTDDDVPALLGHVPVERVLFGSDYPHAEGFAEPRQFLTLLEGLSADVQRRIMRDNARELMRGGVRTP
jgi:predicted TIM-barrel fold metal-dependent hydrolase